MILKAIWFLIENFGDQILSTLRNIFYKINRFTMASADNPRTYFDSTAVTHTHYNYPKWANESSNELMGWKGEHMTDIRFNQTRGLFL